VLRVLSYAAQSEVIVLPTPNSERPHKLYDQAAENQHLTPITINGTRITTR
jgi:hypothetical protein